MFGDYQIITNFNKNVHLAFHRPSSQHVALKRISADSYIDEDFREISDEIKIILSFNHPNIVSIYSVFVDKFDINVILPFFCFGSCEDAMKKYFFTGFPESKLKCCNIDSIDYHVYFLVICAFILRDLLTGLEYLHKRQIIHR
jgi:STE20-related kinase adapter protein alpha